MQGKATETLKTAILTAKKTTTTTTKKQKKKTKNKQKKKQRTNQITFEKKVLRLFDWTECNSTKLNAS